MTKKHTPGPWVVCVQDGEEKAYTVFAEHQLVSKHIEAGAWDHFVACAGASHENYEANARLIAAAPDLLSALTELMASAGENITRESDKSLAAILDEPDCPDEAKRQIRAFLIARAAIAKATGDAA